MPAAALEARCSHPDSENCSGGNGVRPAVTAFSYSNAVRRNGIYIGMFPSEVLLWHGSEEGYKSNRLSDLIDPDETLCELEKVVDAPFAFYGITVQLMPSQNWDGNEIWKIMADLKKADPVLQLTVVPDSTWYGLTEQNDCQAVAIAKVKHPLSLL